MRKITLFFIIFVMLTYSDKYLILLNFFLKRSNNQYKNTCHITKQVLHKLLNNENKF